MTRLLGTAATFLCLSLSLQAADISELTQKLKDKDTDARRAAAQALAEMGAAAKPAVGALVAALKDNDLFVRRFAAQAIGEIGPDAKSAVPNLTDMLKNTKEKKEAQEAAALALGKIGSAGITPLVNVVKDRAKDADVRRSAILGLSRMGPEAKTAIPTLVGELKANDGTDKKKKMANPDSIKTDIVTALGEIASAKDGDAIKAIEALVEGKTGKKDKNLSMAVRDAVRKIKART